ncbi:hypothetical protein BDV27DRAFT_141621 [Aspergillus caelatus]|uniref:glutathione transferase n=1 Tax=Aspergillus caelatus TaxID=61420 RepID=A0A5N7AIB6_9EURO|nr:uncharacterized protein BDV27DRAFT_141621 [Aspergillus caelatus]KAE8368928.1 hypothetical protein BDV27DRAFT_141621 [Aspergillus caelatus]
MTKPNTKPITVWLTRKPSWLSASWAVVLILEELQVPYVIESFRFNDVKNRPCTDICPNGGVPGMYHHLEEVYDTEKKVTYEPLNERQLLNQYLHFQMSGQGPYYGQAGWFNVLYHGRIPSTIERYNGQVRRFLDVLSTYLSFMSWNCRLDMLLQTPPGEDPLAKYPDLIDDQGLMPNDMPKGINNIKEYEEQIAREAAEKEEQ